MLIKPSHYDDQGYVIQWRRAWVPSNSLACLYGLMQEARERQVLGADIDIDIHAYDETNTVIPVHRIIQRIRRGGGGGLICLVGVQSNQFPRALDLARPFRAAGLPVAIGGFHVSGCLAMLPELPPELRTAMDEGITLFAGEGEGRVIDLLRAAHAGTLQPLYDFMDDLPDMQGQPLPFLPPEVVRRYSTMPGTFDAGRGCPFTCSFCTIINVQGRRSRYRDADDVERLLRANLAHGIRQYFITDDNFARNRNWQTIFERIAAVREELGVRFSFTIQVDTMCHTLPGFVERARQAGVSRVFIGLENINPANLQAAGKKQNKIANYREMLLTWQRARVTTLCGYILGFPGDTVESIRADIELIKRELPLDVLEFFCLTPLPGSADHQTLHKAGVALEPDLNAYDLEHVCTTHPLMTKAEWLGIYREAWDIFYSRDHLERQMRRIATFGRNPLRIMQTALQYYGCIRFEGVHPLQGGFFRRKVRTQRRPGFPTENPLLFYPRRIGEFLWTYSRFLVYAFGVWRLYRRVRAETRPKDGRVPAPYMDTALRDPGAQRTEDDPLDTKGSADSALVAAK
ncbi:radical SAM protein [Thioalkalicoccus limnaeus]|uniref:Radical SAM protein n=1 Tax=Thioalkalicoccus limnaeus TaxID=120681 RepID=A0ABV4BDI3_9GAMM